MRSRLTDPDPDPRPIELRARSMYQRVLTQWAGDYLLCRSLWTTRRRRTAPHAGPQPDRFAPACWRLGED